MQVHLDILPALFSSCRPIRWSEERVCTHPTPPAYPPTFPAPVNSQVSGPPRAHLASVVRTYGWCEGTSVPRPCAYLLTFPFPCVFLIHHLAFLSTSPFTFCLLSGLPFWCAGILPSTVQLLNLIIPMHTHTNTHTRTSSYRRTFIIAYIYRCMHIYAYVHTHIHTYIIYNTFSKDN